MDPAALYQQLGELASTMPDLNNDWTSPDALKWLGRASALVEIGGNQADIASLTFLSNDLGTGSPLRHAQYVRTIATIVHRALARAELAAPASLQGAFVPVGEPFTALSAVGKILGHAASSALMIDPYADANILTDFAVLAPERVRVMILADREDHKPSLKPAAERWMQQHGDLRPLQVRLAPAKTLHDRLIVVDRREVWSVGQSFNAIARRAHTSLDRTDPESATRKMQAYESMWAAAETMIG